MLEDSYLLSCLPWAKSASPRVISPTAKMAPCRKYRSIPHVNGSNLGNTVQTDNKNQSLQW